MTPDEVAKMLGYCSTIDPKISAGSQLQVRSWSGLLADVPLQVAREAVDAHYRSSADTIMPSHIVEYWKRSRREQVERQHSDEMKALTHRQVPVPLQSLAERFAVQRAIRRGEDPELAESEASARQVWRSVACPYCKARPKYPCVVPGTQKELRKTPAHPARLDAAAAALKDEKPA